MMELNVQTINCPNCAKKLVGIVDEKGGTKLNCDRCGMVMYSKKITPHRIRLDITLPLQN